MYRLLSLALLATLILGSGVVYAWQSFYAREVSRLHSNAQLELQQAVDQFYAQVSTARTLPTLLARSETVVEGYNTNRFGANLQDYLIRAHDLSQAYQIALLDAQGAELATTRADEPAEFHGAKSYFRTAMNGSLGVAISYIAGDQVRTVTFARSVVGDGGQQVGVAVLDVDLEPLESNFRARPYVLMLRDPSDTIVFSNRDGLVFRRLTETPVDPQTATPLGPYPAQLISNETLTRADVAGVELWKDVTPLPQAEPWIVARQQVLRLDLEAVLLMNSAPARQQATKLTWLMGVSFAFVAMSAFAVYQRRRRLMVRLETESRLNAELDQRISQRSAELEEVQSQLVQAAKLSALGTMSAGISHELNQPIGAIQNFAFMARRFTQDDNAAATLANLTDIEKQTERMSRIIRNLRDFARKDDLPSAAVDICEVVRQASDLSAPRMAAEGVTLSLHNTQEPQIVRGGEVRLQQVILNLTENAADALADRADKRIQISVHPKPGKVDVIVQDNGAGISEPERVFEPFYSTKSGAKDEGLGLGLSISYGFVESFGGSLRATNAPEGGARFTLSLPAIDPIQPAQKVTEQ